MFVSNFIFISLIWYYIIIFPHAVCQVCVETQMVYRNVPETYLYTYMEVYEKSNCLFWCTDTRVATAMGTRNVQKLVPEQLNVCCEGYIKDDNHDSNSIHCKPLCSPSCFNGYCKAPGLCACDPGYLPDPLDPHSCSPLCMKRCEHGTCTAPNICECNQGYVLQNDECEPVCSQPCIDGTCVAPETCQCHPGFKKSEDDTCEPHCSSYTASNECVVTINCEPGWTKVYKGPFEECEPECTKPCINGTCIAPDICECLAGYKKSNDDVCEPYCSECEHGSCISPETCICDPGWYMKESRGSCLPHCDHKCGNGTCVAPDVCECFVGYKINDKISEEDTVCVPNCINCESVCIAPEQCICEPLKESVHVSADGGPCDCFNNCSDRSKKCEKIICQINTAETVTEGDVNEVTIVTNEISTTDEYEVTTDSYNDYNELVINKASWFNATWCYAAGSIFILIIIILIATIILKRKSFESFNKNLFNGQSPDISTAVLYKPNSTV